MTRQSERLAAAAPNPRARGVSRRGFLRGAAAWTVGLLAGCRFSQQPPDAPVPDASGAPGTAEGGSPAEPEPTGVTTSVPRAPAVPHTPAASAGPMADIRRPEVIRCYPDVPSRLVQAHHSGVWTGQPQGGTRDNELLVPQALRQMLDAAVAGLVGVNDAGEAWAALFGPKERIAIKVNTLGFPGVAPFWTHAPLVAALTECLQGVGVPAEQIYLYDLTTADLRGAGYTINRRGPGVRCYGTAESWDDRKTSDGRTRWVAGAFVSGWTISGRAVRLSEILLQCDALINVPRLSDHSLSGITFAMKNHYGTFDSAPAFHKHPSFCQAVVELNALPPIRERTRLIIGDVLTLVGWDGVVQGDSILASYDPVATDSLALKLWLDAWPAGSEGLTPDAVVGRATPWLENAAKVHLGTNHLEQIEVVELELS